MRTFFPKLALLASLAAFGRAEDSCEQKDDSPFAPSTSVGLSGDSSDAGPWSCVSRWSNGDTIIGIEAWASLFAVEGIKFYYANGGDTQWFGRPPTNPDLRSHPETTPKWEPGETVEIKVYANQGQKGPGGTNGIGKIEIFKDDKSIYSVWATKDKAFVEQPAQIDQGAGVILGVKVRADKWVSNLEFKMLKSKVVESTLIDMKFSESMDDWNAKRKGMENVDLASVYYVNPNQPGGSNLTYKFTNKVTKKDTKSHTTQNINTWGIGIEVKSSVEFGIPELADHKTEVAVKTNYEHQWMKSDTDTEEHDQDLTWELATGATNNMLEPQTAVHCTAWAVSGKFESDYTGTVQAVLADGGRYNYYTKGHASSVSYVDAQAKCETMKLKDVPEDADKEVPINKRAVVFQG